MFLTLINWSICLCIRLFTNYPLTHWSIHENCIHAFLYYCIHTCINAFLQSCTLLFIISSSICSSHKHMVSLVMFDLFVAIHVCLNVVFITYIDTYWHTIRSVCQRIDPIGLLCHFSCSFSLYWIFIVFTMFSISHRIHVWYIYLHLP